MGTTNEETSKYAPSLISQSSPLGNINSIQRNFPTAQHAPQALHPREGQTNQTPVMHKTSSYVATQPPRANDKRETQTQRPNHSHHSQQNYYDSRNLTQTSRYPREECTPLPSQLPNPSATVLQSTVNQQPAPYLRMPHSYFSSQTSNVRTIESPHPIPLQQQSYKIQRPYSRPTSLVPQGFVQQKKESDTGNQKSRNLQAFPQQTRPPNPNLPRVSVAQPQVFTPRQPPQPSAPTQPFSRPRPIQQFATTTRSGTPQTQGSREFESRQLPIRESRSIQIRPNASLPTQQRPQWNQNVHQNRASVLGGTDLSSETPQAPTFKSPIKPQNWETSTSRTFENNNSDPPMSKVFGGKAQILALQRKSARPRSVLDLPFNNVSVEESNEAQDYFDILDCLQVEP